LVTALKSAGDGDAELGSGKSVARLLSHLSTLAAKMAAEKSAAVAQSCVGLCKQVSHSKREQNKFWILRVLVFNVPRRTHLCFENALGYLLFCRF
jgi:hypothetical protein